MQLVLPVIGCWNVDETNLFKIYKTKNNHKSIFDEMTFSNLILTMFEKHFLNLRFSLLYKN